MRCRRMIKQDDGTYFLVWFGCKGITSRVSNSETIIEPQFFNDNNKHDNYGSEQEGVYYSLLQRLSVLKYELWYDYNNGMPVVDKNRDKAIIDAYIIKTILAHPDVLDIENFSSSVTGHKYECSVKVVSKYGSIDLTL